MAILSKKISVFSDGSLLSQNASQLYRIPHDCELDANGKFVLGKRDGVPQREFPTDPIPEPFRASPDQTIPVKNYLELLDLLCELNPEYTRERALQLLGTGLCWCNNTDGIFSAAIITGGAMLEKEYTENGKVYFKSILISDPVPTADYVLANHLSTIATSVHKDGRIGIMTRPNGYGSRSPVRMFIVRKTIEPLWFPEDELHKLPDDFDPLSPIWLP